MCVSVHQKQLGGGGGGGGGLGGGGLLYDQFELQCENKCDGQTDRWGTFNTSHPGLSSF